eukprot:TRINITY_DN47385_c0_g1_i1.p1 TRINITY_DN47385_c0_g1~~TRINITY_DN47385_c0_g1_i1.p1  ORF type:complete len:662 (+),score=228.53 TRINITY_DN47385_c0_g1_i1:83-2068(+)
MVVSAQRGEQPHGGGALYSLLVYVDNSVAPVRMDVPASDATELVLGVQERLGLPVVSVSYWDEDFGEYAQLKTLAPLALIGGKGKLWVATQGIKAMPITEEKDALEHGVIREAVERLSPPSPDVVFDLREIVRIQNHEFEQRFAARRRQLFDPSARTLLKFYAGQQPPEDAAREGFRLPSQPGPYGLGVIFSGDISVAHVSDEVKLLLCEVAVGRFTTLHNEQDRGVTLEVLRHMGYDSVLSRTTTHPSQPRLEEHIIYHPHQAVARYLVTCGFRRGPTIRPELRGAPADAHMWCLQCGHLVSAMELLGRHQGHAAKGIDEVASRERDLLTRCDAILERTIEQRQRDLAELEKMKAHYSQEGRDTMQRTKALVDDLKGCLDAKYMELLTQTDVREQAVVARLGGLVQPLQDEASQLVAKQLQLREALELARHPTAAAQAEFLSRVTDLHNSLNTHPKFDEAPDVSPYTPSLSLTIDGSACYDAIQRLGVADASGFAAGSAAQPPGVPPAAHPLGTAALRPEGLLLRDDSLGTTAARLAAVEQGHLWVVPNALQHFAHDQTRDIFSDPFVLGGQTWELKVSFLSGERAVAVYLHAVRHQMRTNFRVAVFRPGSWHVKSTRNWADEFKGRGWGIKPYISLDDLHSFIVNDTLKWLVVFTGNLY